MASPFSFRWSRLPWLLLASLVLLYAGLYNGFPLVTSDTGTYLNSALNFTVPDDRPITYGLFARAAALGFSLWFVVFFQCLILGGLLLRYIREFAPRVAHPAAQLALLTLGVWATGVSWFSSQLMPDIFTPIGLMTLALVLLGRSRSGLERAAWLALALLAGLMHTSNLLTFSLVVFGLGLGAWRGGWFSRGLLRRRDWQLATAVVLAGWLVLPTLHLAFGGGFTLSRASPAFLMARLNESGILERFLDRECATGHYALCAYRDKLPNDAVTFMWDGNSPLNLAGGWNATRAEYQHIIGKIARSPRYYPYLASETAQATLRQLTHVGLGDGLTPFRENTNPYWKVGEFRTYELKEYLSSMQNHNLLSFSSLNERVYLAYVLALLAGLLGLSSPAVRRWAGAPTALLLTVLGLGIGANALVTGALANVLDRLQARTAWLLPFVVLVLATEMLLTWWAARHAPAPEPVFTPE
ncbi:hypothetical protein [Hymenobacter sedentarius]|uniref:hypothetical protein n=1 Tax=Hymenobacter sedentarius TaxID=1411621 RepID=UPI000A660F7E|nr:hypothetical protein [Hymenobacter sedentarius]